MGNNDEKIGECHKQHYFYKFQLEIELARPE
jgi:hypothetical protein